MTFKTIFNDINKVAIARDSLSSIRFDSKNVVVVEAYKNAIKGLNEEQARYVLSKRHVSEADQADLLTKAEIIAVNDGLKASELSRQLVLQGVRKEQAEALIEQISGNEAITSNTVLTKEQTIAILEQAEARKILSAQQRKNIADDIKETASSAQEASAEMAQASADVAESGAKMGSASSVLARSVTQLGVGFKSLLSIFVSSPVAVIATLTGSVIGLTYVIGKFQDTAKNAAKAASEFSSSMSSANSTYNQESDSLNDLTEKYEDLREQLISAKGDEEKTYDIKSQLLELQEQLNEIYGDECDKVNLVTDAYKDQTAELKKNAKQKADNYLNTHVDEINEATKKMTTDYEYELGNFNYGLQDTSVGNELHEQIKKLAEKSGIEWDDNKGFVFKGTAEEASKAIDQFMTDVRELRDSEDGLSDGIINNLKAFDSSMSDQLGVANEIIDGYQETYETAQMAQIASDKDLSQGYNEAVSAVEAYNDAVSKSDNPYDDENVKKAWDNLQTVKSGIQGNEDEWGQYSNIMDKVFSSASDDVYSFYQAIQNDDSIKSLTNDLQGLTDVDLQSMANDDTEDSFDKLCEAAKKYGLEVQDVIDLLIQLGIVQGKVQEQSSNETPISSTDILAQVQALSTGLDQLDKIYADVYNKEDFDWSSILNNDGFKEAFGNMTNVTEEYKNAYDDFIKTINNNPSDLSACQSAFNNLATAYIYNSDALKNVTEDTKASAIAMLEQMGIANAEEVVTAQIANNLLEARAATLDFASATDADINSLVAYANQLGLTAADVAQLCLKQIDVSNNPIKTQASLANLQSLISMAGVTGDKLTYLLKMINAVNNVASLAASGKATQSQITAAGRIVENLQGQMKNISTANVKPQVSYSGGTSTKSAINKANKSSGSSSKDSKETKETFNWVETAISRIQRAVTNLGKTVSATYKSWSTRNSALSSEMSAVTQEISVQQSAYQAYMDKANSVGLSDHYKSLVQNGAMSIEDITDDTLKEQIQTYKDYYEKALSASDAVQDLRDNLAELAKTKFDNLTKEYDNKISDIDHIVTSIENEISGVEESNKIAGKSFYNVLIEQENQRLKDLEEKKSSLLNTINESVYNGAIEYGSEQWYEMKTEIDSVDEAIQNANNSLIEYKQNLKEVAKLNFDNLKEQFENALSIVTDGSDLIDSYMSQVETSGEIVGKSFYSATIDLKNADINGLKKQYETLSSTLNEAMSSGDVEKYDKTWYSMTNEINSVEKSFVNANTELIELRNNLKEVDKLKFDSLVTQFDNALSQIEHEGNKLNSVISIIEESGHIASNNYYDVLITAEKSNVDVLLKKYDDLKNSLQDALDNGSVSEFDNNWVSMTSDIQGTEDALLNAQKALIQYNNALRQIQWDLFDRMQTSFTNLADESDFLIQLMSKNSKLYDDNGQMNSKGLAVQGLHALNYDNAINQAKEYKEEIAKVKEELAADPKNTTLIDRYAELLKEQHTAILNAEDEKAAIIDLISDGYDKLLSSLQDVIDKRKEALNAEKDLYDYQKNISKLSETKTNIEKQLAVYATGSDSEELKATIQKLQKNLAEANEDLADAEYDKYISDQQQILDTLYDNTQEWINTRLDDIDSLFQEAIATTNANSDRITAEIQTDTSSVGALVSDEMHIIWEDGGAGHNVVQGTTDAVNALYGHATTTAQTTFDNIKINTLSLATVFSSVTNSDIANSLTNIGNATAYANTIAAKTSEISGSLNGTIANKIDDVKTAIGEIKTAISEMGVLISTSFSNAVGNLSNSYVQSYPSVSTNTQTETETSNGSGGTSTKTKTETNTNLKPGKTGGTIKKPGKTMTSNSGATTHPMYNIATRYAKGGNVSSKTKSPFDALAQSIGEDTMVAVKEGERILTPVQNEAFEALVENLTKFDTSQLYQIPTIPKFNSMLNNVGSTKNDIHMEVVLPSVKNYDDFVNQMQKDKRFEKIIQGMTVDVMSGKSNYSKMKW